MFFSIEYFNRLTISLHAVVPPLSSPSEMLKVPEARNSISALRDGILRELVENIGL